MSEHSMQKIIIIIVKKSINKKNYFRTGYLLKSKVKGGRGDACNPILGK